MKIAICFFGATTMMDRFMTQNFSRCVLSPLSRYFQDDLDFYYCVHSFMGDDTFAVLDVLKNAFPLSAITLHDRDATLQKKPTGRQEGDFLRHYSLQRVKKLWKSSFFPAFDLVVCVSLDILFSTPLSENDIELILRNKNHIFVCGTLPRHFAIGSPDALGVYAELGADLEFTTSSTLFFETLRSLPNVRFQTISVAFVRILPDGVVCPEDCRTCPYLNDLISSSSTKIRFTRRKSSSAVHK